MNSHASTALDARPRAAEPFRRRQTIRHLRRAELPADTIKLARYLIGKTLVHDVAEGRLSGRIVEAEAYPIGDAAAHAFRGPTPRNRSLFLERGRAYVFFNYGAHWMMNVSAEQAGVGGGVLIRGLEPLEGIAQMGRNRGVARLEGLTRGPGRLALAMGISKAHDGLDLCSPESELWLGAAVKRVGEIKVTTRIGLSREAHRKLRFYERGNNFVSGPRRMLV